MSEKRINLLSALSWLALIIAAGVFSALLYKTSPYRLLRPYPFFGAAVAETESGNANGRIIRIPAHAARDGRPFRIDQRPITIGAYLKCVQAGRCAEPHYRGYFEKYVRNPFFRSFPVTYVAVSEAQQYCAAHGGTLPTAAQWEDAAGAQLGCRYPWGDETPSIIYANFDGLYQGLIPSGWLPAGASPLGVLDMGGNVREWVSDTVPNADPQWPDENILKGGGSSDYPNQLEIAAFQVHSGASAGFNRGFRCVYPDNEAGSRK